MGFAREMADTVCFLDGGVLLERGSPDRMPRRGRPRPGLPPAEVVDAGRL